ncbi:Lrp/AsnC family transcriptional regulator [Arthrobacter sp. I2-34]|uniref:Lrp/AsnC family transcriptional regulator n=1 Tax=Arthrobacter hankyongi TaxID=2904801 RepID=A0ABS9LC16_9MICC|nr:AsnC family transcriptional regulator [Arthrobacter hankyongi]MCG2624219.1 Lrp/AsnC family transcriptional regulator [Arthrobacter hankyongi]
MTRIDDRIYSLLQEDGRLSYSELAQCAGASRAAVTARLDGLLASGDLRVVAAAHPQFLGLHAFAHLSIQTAGPAEPVIGQLCRMQGIVFVSATSGAHDIVVEARLPNQAELYAVVAKVRDLPDVLTVNTLSYVDVVRGIFMPRQALPEGLRIDQSDLKLMRLLQEDGRMSYRELAGRVGLSPSAARTRVNALVAQSVIRIGAARRRQGGDGAVAAGVGINVAGEGTEVIGRFGQLAGIEFLARTIGRFDFVATVAADSGAGLRRAIEHIKGSADVRKVESWVHLEVFREHYEWPMPEVR